MTISGQYLATRFESSRLLRYPVQFESLAQLEVYRVKPGDRLLLTPGLHYWVDTSEQPGPLYQRCDVVLRAPVPEGARVEIQRNTAKASDFDAKPLKSFPADAFERTLDQLCMAQQEIEAHACDCRGDEYQGIPEVND